MGFELKEKTKWSSCFSCCFRVSGGGGSGGDDGDVSGRPAVALMRSSSAWIRQESSEIRDRCRGLVSKIARHRRRGSAGAGDFKYDPLSYALNFDDGDVAAGHDGSIEFRYRNFSSRLPPSPPVALAVASS